jgi:hypothetical protein
MSSNLKNLHENIGILHYFTMFGKMYSFDFSKRYHECVLVNLKDNNQICFYVFELGLVNKSRVHNKHRVA